MKVTLRIHDGDAVRELEESAADYDTAAAALLARVPEGATKLAFMVER